MNQNFDKMLIIMDLLIIRDIVHLLIMIIINILKMNYWFSDRPERTFHGSLIAEQQPRLTAIYSAAVHCREVECPFNAGEFHLPSGISHPNIISFVSRFLCWFRIGCVRMGHRVFSKRFFSVDDIFLKKKLYLFEKILYFFWKKNLIFWKKSLFFWKFFFTFE